MATRATRAADERFVAAVEAIYDAAPDPSRWPNALQKIGDCFDDLGATILWQRDDGGFGAITSPSLVEAQRDYVENGWHLRDIASQNAIERALWLRGDAWTISDMVSDEEMATHPMCTEFLVRHGIRWTVSVCVAPDAHFAVVLVVQRGGHKAPYSDAEIAIAMRLGRHVEKSLRLSIRLLNAEVATVGLGEALSRLSVGVFALDSLGRVVFANPAGELLLGHQIKIAAGRLRLGSGEERAAIDAEVTLMLRGEPADLASDPKPILLRRPLPRRPLVVYLLPIAPRASAAEQFLTHARAIVLVIEPEASAPADPAVVRDILGLTLGEARVASLIGAGVPPSTAAERLGISEGTTRVVLKRIYAKSGVSRQSELAALLTRLAVAPAKRPRIPNGR